MVQLLSNRGAWSHWIPRPIIGSEYFGNTVTFIIVAEGDGLTYQWLCRAPGASSFEYLTGSDATSSTLRVEMTAESNGAPLNMTYKGTVYYIIDPFCPLFYKMSGK